MERFTCKQVTSTNDCSCAELSTYKVPYKHLVAAVFVTALFLDLLDMTITNVALPSLERDFDATPAGLQWVTTAYLLAMASLTPLSGWIVNQLGSKRIFLAALAIFTTSSALCAAAWNLESLIAFRGMQGVGGSLLTPVGMAMLLRAYPIEERATASAVIAVPAAVAPALGPVLGGYLVQFHSWHWVFLVNVPVGFVVLSFAAWKLREERLPPAGQLDGKGFALGATGLAVTLYALAQIGEHGIQDMPALLLGFFGVGLFATFVRTERRAVAPLIDLHLFGNRAFGCGNAVMFVAGVAFAAILFLLPLFLQMTCRLSAFDAGLITSAHAVGILVMMPVAPRLYKRVGARVILTTGMLGMGLATLGFNVSTNAWLLCAVMFANGMTYGLIIVALQTAPFDALMPAQVGQATAAFSVVRQMSLSVGVALTATVLSTRLLAHHAVLNGSSSGSGQLAAYHEAFAVAATISLLGAGISQLMPRETLARTSA